MNAQNFQNKITQISFNQENSDFALPTFGNHNQNSQSNINSQQKLNFQKCFKPNHIFQNILTESNDTHEAHKSDPLHYKYKIQQLNKQIHQNSSFINLMEDSDNLQKQENILQPNIQREIQKAQFLPKIKNKNSGHNNQSNCSDKKDKKNKIIVNKNNIGEQVYHPIYRFRYKHIKSLDARPNKNSQKLIGFLENNNLKQGAYIPNQYSKMSSQVSLEKKHKKQKFMFLKKNKKTQDKDSLNLLSSFYERNIVKSLSEKKFQFINQYKKIDEGTRKLDNGKVNNKITRKHKKKNTCINIQSLSKLEKNSISKKMIKNLGQSPQINNKPAFKKPNLIYSLNNHAKQDRKF